MLLAAGRDVPARAAMNLAAAPGVAVREFRTDTVPADDVLFPGNLSVGIVEPQKADATVSRVEAQGRDDAAGHGAALGREPPPVVYSPALPPELFDGVGVASLILDPTFLQRMGDAGGAHVAERFSQRGFGARWDARLRRVGPRPRPPRARC
jgi:hypothetical protein